jgi:mono/diheme cytochrome c family protein
MLPRSAIGILCGALLLRPGGLVRAQETSADTGASTLQGVYSEGQARKGGEAFRKHCLECHAPEQHTGDAFRKAWNGRRAFDLFELLRTTMPNDRPGRLSRGQYAEIVAYLFQLNGLPAGRKALPNDDQGLLRIRIEAP